MSFAAFSFIVLAGGIADMIRGGLWNVKNSRYIYALTWASCMTFLSWHVCASRITLFIFSYGCILYACSLAWGKWIGTLLNGQQNDSASNNPTIDQIINKYKSQPTLWGMLGLTLHGFLMGVLIAAPLQSWSIVVGSTFLGLSFWLAKIINSIIIKYNPKIKTDNWKIGEFLYGCFLFGGLAFNFLVSENYVLPTIF